MTSIFVTFFFCAAAHLIIRCRDRLTRWKPAPVRLASDRCERKKINQKRASSVIDRQKPNKWLRLDSLRQRLVISLFFASRQCEAPAATDT